MKQEDWKILNTFANDHVLATHIKVDMNEHHTSFKPRVMGSPAYYEDCCLLSTFISGAESFVYWMNRNGYSIVKDKKCVKKSKTYLS